jgi:anaerobic selenocysteine-containing dehydrogenase
MSPEPRLALSKPVSDEVRKTTCYMCACRCGINVHLKDGKVRYIEGNRDHPVNRGVLCAKGSAGIMQHYSPGKAAEAAAKAHRRRVAPASSSRDRAGTRRWARRPIAWPGPGEPIRRSSPSSPAATSRNR